jgi:guanylate kinase
MSAPAHAPEVARRGILYVLSSPSGAGKTTLSRRLVAAEPNVRMSVSVTTRKPRPGEIEGVHYHFIDEQEFLRRRDAGELLEWANVFGRLYGTPRSAVVNWLDAGYDVLFDIDWQGAQQLAAVEDLAKDLVRVFILPPDGPTLHGRLVARASDAAEVVAERMRKAAGEIAHWHEYDYVVINRDLDQAAAEVRAILVAERVRRERRHGLSGFVDELMKSL